MALSKKSTKIALKIFEQLGARVPGTIQDMQDWTTEHRANPDTNTVFGFGQKSDGGYESICFFIENPPAPLKQQFDSLKKQISNTAVYKPYWMNTKLTVIGWF